MDARAITDTIERALRSAGLQTGAGPARGVTETIRQALRFAASRAPLHRDWQGDTIDVPAREKVDSAPVPRAVPDARSPAAKPSTGGTPGLGTAAGGQFIQRVFAGAAGTRAYKLYVPAGHAADPDRPMPLIVMLHGCTQNADDFATGTRMNALAERHGLLVAYPEQARNANHANCWNWFDAAHQRRETGEPSLIAGIVREVSASYAVEDVFVAGLSAGAAMAVVLGATYPDLFTAVGAHSGLPYGAAYDVQSAFAAMRNGKRTDTMPFVTRRAAAAAAPPRLVPTIVFHGDADDKVHAANGEAIVAQAIAARADLHQRVQQGRASAGRTYERTVFVDDVDRPVVEHWVVHGGGHAWSGGGAGGSYTDGRGPDASAEMVRFFLAQRATTSA